MRKSKWINNKAFIIILIILVVVFAAFLYYDNKQQQIKAEEIMAQSAYADEQRKQDAVNSRVFVCVDNDISVSSYGAETVLFEVGSLKDKAIYNDYKSNEVSFDIDVSPESNSCCILRLIMEAEKECAKVTISVNNGEVTAAYPVYTQQAEFSIPVADIGYLDSIQLISSDDSQKIYLSDIKLFECVSNNVNSLHTGIYLCNASETVISENEAVGEASKAMTVCDNYLYSVRNGVLNVYNISDNGIAAAAELNGIGEAVDIVSVNNGKGLAVSSRANGVYLVDISDPLNPVIASHYDTLELATGISVCNNYLFVSVRYFGIEIIDISDIYNPDYITQIYSEEKEYFDCSYYDGKLYISAWGQQEVEVYDLVSYSSPRQVMSFTVDGNPGGITAKDGFLYISTGYHSQDDSSKVTSPGYGQGNGLEIYDISEPSSPKWISSSKIDGRYRYSGNDFWKVKVSGNTAVLADTYNGVYIYDISDPSAPRRIDHVTVRIDKESSNYKKLEGSNYVFSWDTGEYGRAPIISLAVSDGTVFLGDVYTGIYQYKLEGITAENKNGSDAAKININSDETVTEPSDKVTAVYSLDGSVYAADSANGMIFAATSKGIAVLDSELNELFFRTTSEAVRDLAVSNDGKWLFTAESEAGVAIYGIEGSELIETGRCALNDNTFSATSLTLSSDNTAIAVQTGFAQMAFVNVTERNNPAIKSYYTDATMYYRNLAVNTLTKDKGYILGYDRSEYYIMNAADGSVDVSKLTNSYSGERDGIAVTGDKAVAIAKGGYIYFDPLTVSETELKNLEANKISDVTLHGKANINDNGTRMAVSDCITGDVTLVNIEDLDNPQPVYKFNVKGGVNPDIASFYDDSVLIPLRRGGLLKMKAE